MWRITYKLDYLGMFVLGVGMILVLAGLVWGISLLKTTYQAYQTPATIATWQDDSKTTSCYLAIRRKNVQAMWCVPTDMK